MPKKDIDMFSKLRKYFISGLMVFLPMGLTVYLFIMVINYADRLLGKYIEPYFYKNFGFYFRGLGIILLVYLITVVGFLVTNFLGRKIHHFFEKLFLHLPFFKQVYPALKQMAVFLFSQERINSFKKVVLVEYPRNGIYAFGFLTNEAPDKINKKIGEEVCSVFLPSAPGPLTGYVVFVPKDQIIITDITIEEAVKVIVSGGVVNP